ncbi:MAG TPA: sulfur transferase domain-containing protein [Thalassobaculum sp.]
MIDLPWTAEPTAALSPAERRRAWMNMMFVDHGFLREIYVHRHRIADGVWRAAQPAPRHFEKFAAEGIRTILNLRGGRTSCGAYALEAETCSRLGLRLVNFPLRSRSSLDRDTVLAAIDVWDGLELPLLMHCKSGADRTGFMATMYLWQRAKVPLREAMSQLSWRYGHIRQAKTGVIDYFFESYLAAEAKTGIDFRAWVATEYDPARLNASFRENWLAGILVNKILRRE